MEEDDLKYCWVIAALDQQGARRAIQLLHSPLQLGKYEALKKLLIRRYLLSPAERVDKILSLPGIGDGKAVDRMDYKLSPLRADGGGFLFPYIFSCHFPAQICAALAYTLSSHLPHYYQCQSEI